MTTEHRADVDRIRHTAYWSRWLRAAAKPDPGVPWTAVAERKQDGWGRRGNQYLETTARGWS